ncbi:hypothetical protein QNH23_08485 [Siminovitchia fortis]|uniref:Uncharacterized protein n=1 Tax=Siminovitchia fortis TaxID=254758 RepID=A0A443IQ27_9BACI|nr:hypothetical protein [Siminovitchia fortis]RWR08192.1 hypothetical protein D4N35_011910 [Siminovitchia fortis]WHY83390.1 hypothetical protein QNH23_08485 [Siminovitchia fortis]
MLTYEDVEKIIPETKGVKNAAISFGCIAFASNEEQPKGLFVQTGQDEDLQAAISNGAVAAVWPSEKELPFYTPNHFPVFLAQEGPLSAVLQILENYSRKMGIEKTDNKTRVILPESDGSAVPDDFIETTRQLIHSGENCVDGNGVR